MTQETAPPTTRAPRKGLANQAPEVLVEGFTMTLYVSLSLLAVVVAMPSGTSKEATAELVRLILLTCIGLVMAHLVAFRLSARMVHGGQLPPDGPRIVTAQIVGGLAVGVMAIVPVLLLGAGMGSAIAELLLLGIVVLAGDVVARRAGLSRTRRLAYVGGVVLMVVLILAVKAAAGH